MRALSNVRQLWLVGAIALTMTGCFFSERQDKPRPMAPGKYGGGGHDGTPGSPAPRRRGQSFPRGSLARRSPVSASARPTPSTERLRSGRRRTDFQHREPPFWATFNPATGRLAGSPDSGDVGSSAMSRITVATTREPRRFLHAFQIDVTQVALGSVTLSWTPPTTNADGSPMTDLAATAFTTGRAASSLDQIVPVTNAGTIRFVVDNLSPVAGVLLDDGDQQRPASKARFEHCFH